MPRPPIQMHKGPQVCSHFLRKGVLFGHSSLEDFPREPGIGGVYGKIQWLPIPEIYFLLKLVGGSGDEE